MVWHLISATPSPYARKIRIALQEKKLPFELQTEVPWDHTTQTPTHNPLENYQFYESHYILDWLETKYPDPSLLPKDVDERLLAKQIEVVADGVCDALVLAFFEMKREKESQPQMRKVTGGLRALNAWVEERARTRLHGSTLAGSRMEERVSCYGKVLAPSFASTVPVAQKFSDPVV
nr:hypothetical protein B0A51_09838 [Rachicladosporium sp. CCFEE 5018]